MLVTRARALAAMAIGAFVVCAMPVATSCGTSIRGMYESDVRFEHCMALDAASGVKPTIQRGCWEEWVSFYTFGQTRDRIDYARERKRQLGSESDFDEGSEPERKVTVRATPDPTSAAAPPPLMVAAIDAGASPAPPDDTTPRSRCVALCVKARDACRDVCRKTISCDQACAQREMRCETRCPP
jgi:hypothetical protein